MMSIHIHRRVHRNSLPDLNFRNNLERSFGYDRITPRSNIGLHLSLFSGRELNDTTLALNQATAQILLNQPETSRQNIAATIEDICIVGRSRSHNEFSVALKVERNTLFEADRAYYSQLLGSIATQQFNPHITLAKVTNLDVQEHRRLMAWLEDRAPTSVALTGITMSLGRKDTPSTDIHQLSA